jgi:5-methylcytosine-specific restriction endonuclease McrA
MPAGIYERQKKAEQYRFACESCGGNVERPLNLYKGRQLPKFCSSSCFGNSLRIDAKNKKCCLCGTDFRGRERSKFCSVECVRTSRRKDEAKWRDPDYVREYRRQYALKQRKSGGFDKKRLKVLRSSASASKEQIAAAIEKADGRCVYCGGCSSKLTIDHATPIHFGGKHNIKNLIPCCKSCNSSKGTNDLSDWLFKKHGIYGLARAYTFISKRKINHEFYLETTK